MPSGVRGVTKCWRTVILKGEPSWGAEKKRAREVGGIHVDASNRGTLKGTGGGE